MKKLFVFVLLGGFVLPSASWAIDLKQAKFTQVVNSVDVISQSANGRHAAAVNDIFTMPDVLRTGPDSRAELIADDKTITRVGANTVFSFDPASRTIDLQQGSILFHSPHGKGGGTIHTGSATASVLGTTIVVTTTPNGGFKVLVLEGQAEIRFLNGMHISLTPGQMTFVLPGGGTSPVVVFRLDQQTQGSLLVNGFVDPLPSMPNINAEITRQLYLILNNLATDTGLGVGDNATPGSVQVTDPEQTVLNLQQPPPSDGFNGNASVIGGDKTVNQILPVNYSPLDTAHVETGSFTPPSVPSGSFADGLTLFGIVNPASGFVGNNIDIDTGTRLITDHIDLSSYAGKPDFDFMATGDLKIWQSVSFMNESPASLDPNEPGTIGLLAGGRMLIAQHSTIEADTGILGLAAGSFGVLEIASDSSAGTTAGTANPSYPNTLLNVSIYNNGGDVDLLSESDLTIEGGNFSDTISDTVYAKGVVNIQSMGTLNLGFTETVRPLNNGYGNVQIDAGGDVDLSAGLLTGGDMNVNNTEIYAGDSGLGESSVTGGSLNLNAGGDIYIYGSELYAYSGYSGNGDVNIGAPGTVDLEDAYIYADGNVSIESGGTLTLGDYSGNEIDAGGSVYLASDYSDVNVYDYSIYADGDVNITSGGTVSESLVGDAFGGNIDVEGSDIEAGWNDGYSASGGNVNINAYNGNVTLYDDYVFAYSGDSSAAGNINIYAGRNVDFTHSDVYQDNSVTVTANSGHVNIFDVYNDDYNSSDTYLTDWAITAGCYVDIGADQNVTINYSDVYAGGHVAITSGNSGGGNISIGNSDIFAGWDYNNDESSYSGGSVKISALDGTICLNGDDIEAYSGEYSDGNVCVIAGGNISIKGYSDIYADGNVNITSEGSISAKSLDSLSAGGNIRIKNSDIYAGYDDYYGESYGGGNVTINAYNGSVCLDDAGIYAYGGENNDGDVTINAGGNIGIYDYTDIYAYGGDVSITSGNNAGGYVDVENGYIEANDSVYVTAYGGYVDFYNTEIYADNGEVDVSALDSTVDIEDTYISASGDVSIESGDTLTMGYYDGYYDNNEIDAGGAVNLTSDYGDVDILDYNIYADNGDVDITANGGSISIANDTDYDETIEASGKVDIQAGYDAYVSNYRIYADAGDVDITAQNGGMDVENTYISAHGDVNLHSYGTLYLGWNDGGWRIDAGGNVDLTSYEGKVKVSEYDIYADGGDVTLNAVNSGIKVEDSTVEANNSVTLNAGDCGVNLDYAYLYADNHDIDITATGNGGIYTDYGVISAYGSVNLTAGGDITINYTPISATTGYSLDGGSYSYGKDKVSISSGGQLTINGTYGDNYYGYDIGADSKISLYGANGVSLDDVLAETLSGCYYDKICVTADGEIDIVDGSQLDSSGSVKVEANSGNVYVTDSQIIGNGGSVTISSDNGILVVNAGHDFTGITSLAVGGADIYANGDVTLEGNCVVIKDTAIYADGSVYVTGWDGNVKVKDGDIRTGYGDVDVTAYYGNLTMEAGCVNYGIYIDASGAVNLSADGDVTILGGDQEGYIYAGGGDVTIKSGGGIRVDGLSSASGNLLMEDMYVEADGSVYVTAHGGNVNMSYDEIVADGYSDNGDVNITAYCGTADLENTSIDAAGNVDVESGGMLTVNAGHVYANTTSLLGGDADIYANGDVTLNGGACASVIDTEIYAGGAVTITGQDGNVKVNDANIQTAQTGFGNVDVTANYGNLTMESGSAAYGIYISAGGAVNLSADDDVTIIGGNQAGYIYANGGDLTIQGGSAISISYLSSASGSVDVEGIDAESQGSVYVYSYGGDVYLSGDTIKADGTLANNNGNVTITSYDGTADLENTFITALGNVNIESSGTLTLNTDSSVNAAIAAGGSVNLTSDYSDVNVTGYTIGTSLKPVGADVNVTALDGAIDIEGTGINAGANVIAESDYTLTLGGSYSDNITAGLGVSLTSDYGDVDIYGGSITAKAGDVDITSGGAIALTKNDSYSSEGDIDIEGVTISATPASVINSVTPGTGGNIDISAGGGVTLSDDSITAGGAVNVEADNYDVDISSTSSTAVSSISGASGVTITADYGAVNITDTGISSGNGNVNITAANALNIAEDGTLHSITGNNVYLTSTGGQGISISGANIASKNGDVVINAENENTVPSFVGHQARIALADVGGSVDISAGGDVSIISVGPVIPVADSSDPALTLPGDFDIVIENGYIEANSSVILDTPLGTGGYVYLNDTVLISDYGDVSIVGDGYVEIDNSSSINAGGGDVTIDAGGYLDMESSTVTAADWMLLEAGGYVDLYGDNLTANNGDVNIRSYNSYVDLENTYISAGGDVNIRASGSSGNSYAGDVLLGVLDYQNDYNYDNNEIDAGGSVTLQSDNADVLVYGYSIYAYGNSDNGNVDIYAYNGQVDLEYTYISAYGDVVIESGNTLTLGNYSDIYSGVGIDAGGSVTLKSDNADVDIYGSAIGYNWAIGGNVDIYALKGQVDVENAYINANGDVDIESSDTLTLAGYYGVGIDAGGSVTLQSDNADVDIYGSSIGETGAYGYYAPIGGSVNIYAHNGSIDMENTYVEADGNVNIDAGGSVFLYEDGGRYGGIYSDYGDVNITSDGTISESTVNSVFGIDIEYSDIEANGSVNINAYNGNDVYAYADTITADYGDVNINGLASSSSGYVDLEDTEISALGDVNITSGGKLTLGSNGSYDSTINAGGNVYLASGAGVQIGNTTINADSASVVDISGSTISANNGTSLTGNVDISGSGGDVSITGGNSSSVSIYNTTINLGGDVAISGASALSATGVGDVNISTSGGGLSIAAGNVFINGGDNFSGNNISLTSGSSITTADGNVNINDYGTVSISWNNSAGIYGNNTISLGNVDVDGSTITANGGDVNITTEGSVYLASISSSTVHVDDININNSTVDAYSSAPTISFVTASSGDVNLNAGGNVYITGNSTIYASDKVNITASGQEAGTADYGNVDIENSSITAGNGVNVNAEGYVHDYGTTLDLEGWNVTAGDYVELDSPGNITVNGSSLTANAGDVDITSGGTLATGASSIISATVGNVTLDASTGDATLQNTTINANSTAGVSVGNVNVNALNGMVTLTGDTISGNNSVNISAGTGLTVNGGSISSSDPTVGIVTPAVSVAGVGTVNLSSTSGQTTIQGGASVKSYYINVNSPDGILLDGTSGGSLKGNTMNLTASVGTAADDSTGAHSVTVQNTDLGQLANVNIQAHTVNFDSVNFASSSSYNVTVFYHDFYINNGHQAGYANFNNDTLDNVTIVNGQTAGTAHPINTGGIVLGGTGTGIHVN